MVFGVSCEEKICYYHPLTPHCLVAKQPFFEPVGPIVDGLSQPESSPVPVPVPVPVPSFWEQ